jgi:predicted Zn-dependent protease
MEQVSRGQPVEFLSTHPSHGTRIRQLEKWMPEALEHYHGDSRTTVTELPAVGTAPSRETSRLQ